MHGIDFWRSYSSIVYTYASGASWSNETRVLTYSFLVHFNLRLALLCKISQTYFYLFSHIFHWHMYTLSFTHTFFDRLQKRMSQTLWRDTMDEMMIYDLFWCQNGERMVGCWCFLNPSSQCWFFLLLCFPILLLLPMLSLKKKTTISKPWPPTRWHGEGCAEAWYGNVSGSAFSSSSWRSRQSCPWAAQSPWPWWSNTRTRHREHPG